MAGPIEQDSQFTASALCSKQDPPTRILRESKNFGARDCGDDKNVMLYGDGAYEVWFHWTRNDVDRRMKLGSSGTGAGAGRTGLNKLDTGWHNISSARIEVRSAAGQGADDYLVSASTGCSSDTVGD